MQYKARLVVTVILECDVQAANGTKAFQYMKDYENHILSHEWHHKTAPPQVSRVAETLYHSKIDFKNVEPEPGLRIG